MRTNSPSTGDRQLSTVSAGRSLAKPSPSSTAGITPLLVWRATLRWWHVTLPVALTCAAIAAGTIWLLSEPKFRAAAWLEMRETPEHIAYPRQDEARRYVQNQIELMRSSLVVGPVLSDPEIAEMADLREQDDPVLWLSRNLRVVSLGESEIFELSFDSPHPEDAARIVNAVVKSFLNLRNEQDGARNQKLLQLLDDELRLRAQEVARMREVVRTLSKQILGRDPFTGAPSGEVVLLNHPLEGLLNQLSATEVECKILEMQLSAYDTATAQAGEELPVAIIDSAVEKHPSVQEIKALLTNKQGMLERVAQASAHGVNDPAYKRVESEVAQLQKTLERTRISMRPIVQQEMISIAAMKRGDELSQLQNSLEAKRVAKTALQEQYDNRVKTSSQSSSQSLDLEFARAELAREERVYELIAQRALALRTESRAPARVSLVKSATTPAVPFETYPLKKMLMAAAMCFVAPFALAVLWERFVRRIANADQLDQHSLTVVGEVSRLPVARLSKAHDGSIDHDLSLFEESVDSLRTCLILGEDHADIRVIAVASAVSGEGKTSVAAQLAVSIARATGEATLVIDADLRSPSIHRVFQIEGSPGLADVLEGKCDVRDAIHKDWSEFVHAMPAGRAGMTPHALINSPRFKSALDQLREEYRYVIIDTPPVLLASEALVIAKEADGTLLCTMRDHSRESQVQAACERLRAVGARNLGAVLSGIPARQYATKYGKYAYVR
jgi:capsular exopolysaccharide synthesis family protein